MASRSSIFKIIYRKSIYDKQFLILLVRSCSHCYNKNGNNISYAIFIYRRGNLHEKIKKGFLAFLASIVLLSSLPASSLPSPLPVRRQLPAAPRPRSFRSKIKRQRTRSRLFLTNIRACLQILMQSRMAILPWKSTSSSTIL